MLLFGWEKTVISNKKEIPIAGRCIIWALIRNENKVKEKYLE